MQTGPQSTGPQSPTRAQTPPPTPGEAALGADDPLVEIDKLMQGRQREQQQAEEHTAQLQAERSSFAREFTRVCQEQVRPAMEKVLERVRRNGGGGLIEERPGNIAQHQTHRLVLWVSFQDEIEGAPRQDRQPYLQLDAEADKMAVTVSEGDMWQGHGGNRSGRSAEWRLEDITADLVTQEILAIMRRALEPAVYA